MKSNDSWLIAIPAGRWQLSGILKAKELGFRVLGIDGDAHAIGLEFCDKSIIADIRNVEGIISAVNRAGIIPKGVVCFVSEAGMHAVAGLRKEFNLSGPTIDVVEKLTNKISQRSCWSNHGIPGPQWLPFYSVAEGLTRVSEIGLPCVTKPSDSAGSRGVTVVESVGEAEAAIKAALENSHVGSGLVESYIKGIEHTIETFGDGNNIHVLCVTEKIKVAGTRGTVAQELSTVQKSHIHEKVAQTATESLKAIGYVSGPGHIEIIVDKDENPFLVEAAGRGGGFMVFEGLAPKVSGYDLVQATIQEAMQEPITPVTITGRAGILRFVPAKPGTVKEIHGLEEANALEGIQAAALVKIGDKVKKASNDGDRMAYILSVNNSYEKAQINANRATELIRIVISDQPQIK
jgi:biotin carboxylase